MGVRNWKPARLAGAFAAVALQLLPSPTLAQDAPETPSPSMASQPQRAIDKEFEKQVLVQVEASEEITDCINLFHSDEALEYAEANKDAKYVPMDERCLREPGKGGQQTTEGLGGSTVSVGRIVGGISSTRHDIIQGLAYETGRPVNEDSLKLFTAAHEFKHWLDRNETGLTIADREYRGDLFARLVLHAFKDEARADTEVLFQKMRRDDALLNDVHGQWLDVDMEGIVMPKDLMKLNEWANEAYRISPTPVRTAPKQLAGAPK